MAMAKPENLTATVKTENLTATVKTENVTASVKTENMTAKVKPENLTATVKTENMTAKVKKENVPPTVKTEIQAATGKTKNVTATVKTRNLASAVATGNLSSAVATGNLASKVRNLSSAVRNPASAVTTGNLSSEVRNLASAVTTGNLASGVRNPASEVRKPASEVTTGNRSSATATGNLTATPETEALTAKRDVTSKASHGRRTNQLDFMKRVVLETLWSDPLSRPFHRLDLSQYNFNDHSSRLMDMDIIRGRLESRSYLSAHHCIVDFRMIFDDVYKLTSQTNELRVLARALEKKFIQLLENLPETEFEVLEPDHGAQGAEAVAAGPQPQLPTGTTKAEVEQIWTLSTQLKFCVHVFNEVIVEHRELAKVFAAPLIFTLRDSTVVKAPMDLRTVKRKMSSKVYITAEDIESDVRRIFTTCYKCCVERSSLIAKAQKLQHAFEIKFSKKPDESPEVLQMQALIKLRSNDPKPTNKTRHDRKTEPRETRRPQQTRTNDDTDIESDCAESVLDLSYSDLERLEKIRFLKNRYQALLGEFFAQIDLATSEATNKLRHGIKPNKAMAKTSTTLRQTTPKPPRGTNEKKRATPENAQKQNVSPATPTDRLWHALLTPSPSPCMQAVRASSVHTPKTTRRSQANASQTKRKQGGDKPQAKPLPGGASKVKRPLEMTGLDTAQPLPAGISQVKRPVRVDVLDTAKVLPGSSSQMRPHQVIGFNTSQPLPAGASQVKQPQGVNRQGTAQPLPAGTSQVKQPRGVNRQGTAQPLPAGTSQVKQPQGVNRQGTAQPLPAGTSQVKQPQGVNRQGTAQPLPAGASQVKQPQGVNRQGTAQPLPAGTSQVKQPRGVNGLNTTSLLADTVEAKVPWSADKGEVMIYERDIALSETSSGDSDTTSTSYDSDSSD